MPHAPMQVKFERNVTEAKRGPRRERNPNQSRGDGWEDQRHHEKGLDNHNPEDRPENFPRLQRLADVLVKRSEHRVGQQGVEDRWHSLPVVAIENVEEITHENGHQHRNRQTETHDVKSDLGVGGAECLHAVMRLAGVQGQGHDGQKAGPQFHGEHRPFHGHGVDSVGFGPDPFPNGINVEPEKDLSKEAVQKKAP